MSQFSFEQKIEIVSKMALDYCNENGLKFKQYNQKFAELIVRECADWVRTNYDSRNAEPLAFNMEKDFGLHGDYAE